jgi:hypothetical protein
MGWLVDEGKYNGFVGDDEVFTKPYLLNQLHPL